jgi:hypothetical protein
MEKRSFKRNLIGSVGMLLFLSFTGIATAEEAHYSVGLKTWYTQWTETITISSESFRDELKSNDTFMYGPSLGTTYGKFFAGVTYMTGSFEFSEKVASDCGCTISEDVRVESDRDDIDLVIGYKLHPYISPLLGYKQADITSNLTADDVNVGTSEVKFSGPVIGVSANYPLGQSAWTLLGNLNYLWMEYEAGDVTSDAPGFSYELSGLYRVAAVPVHLTVGYKYQEFETDNGSVTDEFSGFTFGANYTF